MKIMNMNAHFKHKIINNNINNMIKKLNILKIFCKEIHHIGNQKKKNQN